MDGRPGRWEFGGGVWLFRMVTELMRKKKHLDTVEIHGERKMYGEMMDEG